MLNLRRQSIPSSAGRAWAITIKYASWLKPHRVLNQDKKGLRGKANNEINEYETGNYLNDAAYAKKKQLELLQMQMGKEMAKGEHMQVDGDDYQIKS